MRALKIDIFHDETFVFTPKGDVITLPQGSTVIDFAYAIHSGVGNKMIGAKINGMIVPIERVPQNGEIVEILTSSASRGPSRDWLKIVKTGEARNKIRQWFKREEREENIAMGRAEIDREFRRYGRGCSEQMKEEIATAVAARFSIKTYEDLCNTIGYGGITISKLAPKLHDEFERRTKAEEAPPAPTDAASVRTKALPHSHKASSGVIVDGVEGCAVKFAKCCNPLPGDELIGFITKGYGISVHKRDCPNVRLSMQREENSDRWVQARWDGEQQSEKSLFETSLNIYAEDRISMIADITTALADMKVSIVSIGARKTGTGGAVINVTVGAKNIDHVRSIVSRLGAIKGVDHVDRRYNT